MTQDVRERRVKVTVDLDLRNFDMWALSGPDELLHRLAAILDYLLRIATQKYLADCLLVVGMNFGLWEMPWRIESLGQC